MSCGSQNGANLINEMENNDTKSRYAFNVPNKTGVIKSFKKPVVNSHLMLHYFSNNKIVAIKQKHNAVRETADKVKSGYSLLI